MKSKMLITNSSLFILLSIPESIIGSGLAILFYFKAITFELRGGAAYCTVALERLVIRFCNCSNKLIVTVKKVIMLSTRIVTNAMWIRPENWLPSYDKYENISLISSNDVKLILFTYETSMMDDGIPKNNNMNNLICVFLLDQIAPKPIKLKKKQIE